MSIWQTRLAWSLVVLLTAGMGMGLLVAENEEAPAEVAAENLLPADPILLVVYDGQLAHEDAYKKTAAYAAFHETGVVDLLKKMVNNVGNQAGASQFAEFKKVFNTLFDNGFSVAVKVEGEQGAFPTGYGVIVLHDAAKLEPKLSAYLRESAGDQLNLVEEQVQGRKVTSTILPDTPGVEFGWWTEGNHLVFTVGIEAVQKAVAVAAGKSPNVTSTDLWKEYHAEDQGFEQTTLMWMDFAQVRELTSNIPLPTSPRQQPLLVEDVLKTLGLNELGPLVAQAGYKGPAQYSQTTLLLPGPRTGLASLLEQKPMKLDQLPPLPVETTGFTAGSLNWSKAYETILQTSREMAALESEDSAAQVEGFIKQIPQMVGIDPKKALLDSLGEITCIYGDDVQGPFGLGFGMAIQVKDEKKLNASLNFLLGMATNNTRRNELAIRRTEKHGRDIITLEIGGGVFNPSYVIDNGWLVIGLIPQVPEAYLLRVDGKLPKWEPSEDITAAMEALPEEYTSITVTHPDRIYKLLMGWAPWFMGVMKAGIGGALDDFGGPRGEEVDLGVSVADLPPAELVIKPLFPNVSLGTVDEQGFRWISRNSSPTIPLLGSANSVAALPVAVGLLLPAVQQARAAARRAQSANHMKQIGLAMHNYHDTFSHFPQALVPNEKLKPEERISWMASILPFIEQNNLYEQIDFKQAWDAEDNDLPMSVQIPVYQNPGIPNDNPQEGEFGTTHYLGVAGVGKDAYTLPANHKRAGIFGYNRATGMRNILDGTSNTVMVLEAYLKEKAYPRWGAGTQSIQALTQKPYINGPDGFGAPWSGNGCQALFADGSVRMISSSIDPSVMEALATMAGGEVVNTQDLNGAAPQRTRPGFGIPREPEPADEKIPNVPEPTIKPLEKESDRPEKGFRPEAPKGTDQKAPKDPFKDLE